MTFIDDTVLIEHTVHRGRDIFICRSVEPYE